MQFDLERGVLRVKAPRLVRDGGIVAASVALLAIACGSARGEPVTDRILSGHQLHVMPGCVLVKINFNIRIRYVSHFPLDRGTELRIGVRPIDPGQAAADVLTRRESLRPPDSRTAPIRSIELETDRADGPVLQIQFLRATAYKVAPGADFESIVIAFHDPRSAKPCKPEFPIASSGPWNATVTRGGDEPAFAPARDHIVAPRDRARPAGPITPADLRAAGAAMDEARAALKRADYTSATRLLTKVLRLAENQYSAEAQELLGVVYQKSGQPAEARAEYEDYLRRYPTGEGTDSVRQRLAGIEAASMSEERKLRAPRSGDGQIDNGPGPTSWTLSGSASQFYVRDDSFRVVRDPSLPPELNPDREDHRVHRNALLSSLDLFAAWGNNQYKTKFRFSGTEEHRFGDDAKDIASVAALFLETAVRDWGTTAKIGRQTRNTGGVLGRFDGGLVSWQASPWLRWNVVGGSPVASRADEPFKDDKYLIGTSVDFGPLLGGLDLSVFFIQQQAHDIIDRQAVGSELRYLDEKRSLFATIDYDTHFQEFNAAIVSGSVTLGDGSTIHGGADYRKSPYLTSWNALIGQPAVTLFDLLKLRTKSEIAQMAVDRTAAYSSANIGYSRPLTDKLQLNLDMTAAHIDGTIASFGVDAMPSTGDEYYFSAQLIGSGLLRDGDLFTAAIRLADREDSTTYVLDFGTRFPITQALRVNPRLFLSYRDGKAIELTEYAVLPSVVVDYYVARDLSFEVEVGAKRTWREQAGVRDNDTELFFTVGYRYDFYADGRPRCAASAPNCK